MHLALECTLLYGAVKQQKVAEPESAEAAGADGVPVRRKSVRQRRSPETAAQAEENIEESDSESEDEPPHPGTSGWMAFPLPGSAVDSEDEAPLSELHAEATGSRSTVQAAVSSKPEESAPIVVPADPWRWAIVDLEQREACVQTREIPLAFKCVLDAIPLENMHSVIQNEFLQGGLTMKDASETFAVVKGSARLKFLTKLSEQNRLWGGCVGRIDIS